MSLSKKVSSVALCATMVGTSLVGVSAETTDSIIGANRYETAAKIADRMGNYTTAILVNSDQSLADGLSASSLAGKENAPILLVKKDSIPKETLSRLKGVNKVYIIGGTSVISKKVESQLSGKSVHRVEGKDRVDTSKKVAQLVGNYDEAFIVNGFKGEADAMSVASVAARDKAPILLTKGTSSNHEVKSNVDYYAIGGTSVISNSVASKYSATRLGGSNRYDTNRLVINEFYPKSSKLYYAKGDPLVDALTVSALAKNNGVVLVSKNSNNSILEGKDTVQVGGMNFSVNSKNTPPVITSSTDTLTFVLGQDEIDMSKFNVRAYDKEDGDLTDKIMVDKLVDFSKPGTYTLTLAVADKEGLTASKVLTVIIKDAEEPSKPTVDINSPEFRRETQLEFLKLINKHRSDNGVAPVNLNDKLSRLAYLKCKHMDDLHYYDHWYDDTKTQYYKDRWNEFNEFGRKMGVEHIYPDECWGIFKLGENLSFGYSDDYITPEELATRYFNSWKKSPAHNRNMLSPSYKDIGIYIYQGTGDSYYDVFATTIFGRRFEVSE